MRFILVLMLFLGGATAADAQCAGGLITNCPSAQLLQPTDQVLVWQLGQVPHQRKTTISTLSSFNLPLAFVQAVQGAVQSPTVLSLARPGSTEGEPAVASLTYTINDIGTGGLTFDRNFHAVDTIQNISPGGVFVNGPAASTIAGQFEVYSSAALSSLSGCTAANCSQHIALWATTYRSLDNLFTPTTGQPYGNQWGQIWNLIDATGLPSSLGGAIQNENDANANNLDDGFSRNMLNFVMGNQQTPGTGVVPVQWGEGIGMYTFASDGASNGAFEDFVRLSGNYTVAALDLRAARPMGTTVMTTLGSPSTTLAVANVLPFTVHGSVLSPVSSTNTLPVLINGDQYYVSGYALSNPINAGHGTITLTTAVSTTDGTAGNAVTGTTAGVWLNYNQPIAWDPTGAHITWDDYTTNSVYNSGGTFRFGTPTSYLTVANNGIYAGGTAAATNIGVAATGTGSVLIGRSPDYGISVTSPSGTVANGFIISGSVAGSAPQIVASGSDTNVGMSLFAQGTGTINLLSRVKLGSANVTANGTGTSAISLAPAGAHAAPVEWLTLTDPSGNTVYVPAF